MPTGMRKKMRCPGDEFSVNIKKIDQIYIECKYKKRSIFLLSNQHELLPMSGFISFGMAAYISARNVKIVIRNGNPHAYNE
jgi:hypothetical protein